MWRPEINVKCGSLSLLHFGAGSPPNPEVVNSSSLIGQRASGILSSLSSQHWATDVCCPAWNLCGRWGSKPAPSCFCHRPFRGILLPIGRLTFNHPSLKMAIMLPHTGPPSHFASTLHKLDDSEPSRANPQGFPPCCTRSSGGESTGHKWLLMFKLTVTTKAQHPATVATSQGPSGHMWSVATAVGSARGQRPILSHV